MKLAYTLLVTALLIVSGLFLYYFYTTQNNIKGLSDNLTKVSDNATKLQTNYDLLAKEYVKVASPKMFKSEADLKTWLNSAESQTITGYMALAQQQGAFMQIWPAWKLTDRFAGMDFSEKWQETKSQVTGMKYALLTVVDKKTYLIDVETKRLIIIEPEASNGTWK
jgi:hypothetical protein